MSRPVKVSTSTEGAGSTIRVVSARTGLGMETLRAWERRYGFPKPERRIGSNRRLYSAADIERLVAIQRAIGRGYRVGDVIAKTLGELARLAPVTEDGLPKLEQVEPSSLALASPDELVELLSQARVRELETQLRRGGVALGPRRFVTDLAHPFAVSVGQAWADGLLTVLHEHLATECLVTQLRQMLAGYQEIETRPHVLLATLPGEPHTLPLQMVALYLVSLGANPRLLGGSTPPRELAESARALGSDVIGLTITATSDRTQARSDVRMLQRALPPRISVWLGGSGAAALDVADERTHVVTSWEAIDHAMARHRALT